MAAPGAPHSARAGLVASHHVRRPKRSRFLDRLTSRARPGIGERVVLVVAHPDDEALACGAVLARLTNLAVVHVTDGAPSNGADAARHGFRGREDYAAARRRELEEALVAAGSPGAHLVSLDVPDQCAALRLAEISRRLPSLLDGAEVVLTHAYEGGHPDHDATAFAVRAAIALMEQRGPAPVPVEMPFYRSAPDGGWLRQSFGDEDATAACLRLTDAERDRKAAALHAHATQRETLAAFGVSDERFRFAAPVDFAEPPNHGDVLYERYAWGMTAKRFRSVARLAMHELGLAARL